MPKNRVDGPRERLRAGRATAADLDALKRMARKGELRDDDAGLLRNALEKARTPEPHDGSHPPAPEPPKKPGGGSGQPPVVPPPPPVVEPPPPVEPPAQPPPVVLPPALKMGTPGTHYVVKAGEELRGLDLGEGSTVEMAGDGARLIGCRVHGTPKGSAAVRVSAGRGVEIAWNLIEDIYGQGISVEAKGAVAEPWIHHNHIRNTIGPDGENEHEALQLGRTHIETSLRAVVEHNLFENCSVDREVISVKSDDNDVQQNTFVDCRKYASNRHGRGNQFRANTYVHSKGEVVLGGGRSATGRDSVIADQQGGDILLMKGDCTQDQLATKPGGYPAASGWRLARNAAEVKVGTFPGRDIPPSGNIEADCGPALAAYVLSADACGCMADRA